MYADEVNGGALFRGLAEYADEPAARRVPLPRRRRRTSRRALGASVARGRRRTAHTTRAVSRARVVFPRPPPRDRGGTAPDVAHRSGRGRPLPRRRRSDRRDGSAGGGRGPHDRGDAGDPRRWPHRALRRPSPSRTRRAAAGHRVRRQRRPGVELLAGDGRRRGHDEQQHRVVGRHRRAGRGRVFDVVGGVDLDPVAARALRERAPHRTGGAPGLSRGGARRARDDLPGQGHRPGGGPRAGRRRS